MSGKERRRFIIELLHNSTEPLSGSALAKKLGVSRQIIVQDIALLRATDKNILSTNKGYICYQPYTEQMQTRVIAVRHSDEQMSEELNIIVDAGAKVKDVIVEHDVYGQISVDLLLESRKDVDEFMEKVSRSKTRPLKELAGGIHYHTIDAPSEEILDLVEDRLKEIGYLILE